jgi:hypothetical protein
LDGSASSPGSTSFVAVGYNADGRMELFRIDVNHTLSHTWQVADNNYFNPGWAPMMTNVSSVTIGKNADQRMEVFAVLTDHALWHTWQVADNNYFAPNGAWLDGSASSAGSTSSVAVGYNADGRMELFRVDVNHTLSHTWQVADNNYFAPGWNSVMLTGVRSVAVGQNTNGTMEVFACGLNGALSTAIQTAPNTFFNSWTSLGGNWLSTIVGRNADGRLEVFGIDNAQQMWHDWQMAPSGPLAPGAVASLVPSLVPNLKAAWNYEGLPTMIRQNGINLTFTNQGGAQSAGYFISATQVVATTWKVFGTISGSPGNYVISWSNGTTWQEG